jgi:hypothetical protein
MRGWTIPGYRCAHPSYARASFSDRLPVLPHRFDKLAQVGHALPNRRDGVTVTVHLIAVESFAHRHRNSAQHPSAHKSRPTDTDAMGYEATFG